MNEMEGFVQFGLGYKIAMALTYDIDICLIILVDKHRLITVWWNNIDFIANYR